MTLIEDFIEATKEYEAPESYFYWSFLAAISAICANKVTLDRYLYKLYPNIYVLLYGKSGLRKSSATTVAERLVASVNNTRIISGRSSFQGIIDDLGTSYSREGGLAPIKDARCFISASEFASSLVEDKQALTTFTDLYDSKRTWDVKLKSGKKHLTNVYITMLGGVNSAHFKETVHNNDIEGGFIGRTFVIYENKRRGINSLMKRPRMSVDDILKHFTPHLIEIANAEGEFELTQDAKDFYDAWYTELTIKSEEFEDKTGTLLRLGDHVLKVAMLLALSEKTLTIWKEVLELAIDACVDFSSNAKRITSSNNKTSQLSPIVHKITELIYRLPSREISRRLLMQKLWGEGVTSKELDTCLQTLIEAGFLMQELRGSDLYLTMDSTGAGAFEDLFGRQGGIG